MAQVIITASKWAGIFGGNTDKTYRNSTATYNALWVGKGVADVYRMLLWFDVSTIPAGATITGASLGIYCTLESDTSDRLITVRQVLKSWNLPDQDRDPPATNSNYPTWSHQLYNATAWAVAGLGDGDRGTVNLATGTITGTGAFSLSGAALTTLVGEWVAGTTSNHGLRLNGPEAAANESKMIAVPDHATSSYHPKLTVDYTLPTRTQVLLGVG